MSYTNKRSFSERKNNTRFRNNKPNFRPKRGGRKKQYINPALFINKNTKVIAEMPVPQVEHQFTDFGFSKNLEHNVTIADLVTPSPIQDQTIPLVLKGSDVIGLANTGTGKTAAFLLPILEKLQKNRKYNSVLVMAPTRELAQQIDAEFRKFSFGLRLYTAVCVGGVNINGQIRQLRRGPHVIIGTPGRLKDLLNRNILQTNSIDTLVLDEADRMLDMGFVHDIREIIGHLPENRQTLCFSATMNSAVQSITHDFMKNPVTVSVKVTETNDHIYQDIVHYHDDEHKKVQLIDMLKQSEFEKVIVFGETKHGVQRLSDKLLNEGIASNAIHGNKNQGQRNRALSSFKSSESKVLVATDVAARGLDIPDVTHVINFDQPTSYDDYVHRIGRTGRGGKSGIALTFVKK